jgi:hypothetical protein
MSYYEVLQFMAETNLGSQGWVGLDDTRGFFILLMPRVIWCDSAIMLRAGSSQSLSWTAFSVSFMSRERGSASG